MKKITLMFTALLLISTLPLFAQMSPTGNLTIFSEDGSKFFLELNGERYNEEAQTNVRIEELPNPYYSCKIIFAEPAKGELVKKNLMIADVDDIMQDVTYRIKTNKQGKRSLSFYSFVPAEQNMVRPANCPVYRYGKPNTMIVDAGGVIVTEQVTVQQTTTTSGMPVAGVSMNVGGMGVSVTVPGTEVAMTTTTTTSTTTTSSGYSQNNNYRDHDRDDRRHDDDRERGCRHAMSNSDFEQVKTTLSEISFDDTRLSTAKQIISSNCLNSNQVMSIMKLFSFEESKLDFAKSAYGYCMDQNNYFKVVNAFTFDSSKNELNNYIQGQH